MNIYVGNLPFSASEDELRKMFEAYGQVDSVSIIMDKFSGRSKGFGFVEMADSAQGQEAVKNLNGKDMDGRPLRVNEALPKSDKPRGGGYGGGGGGGGGGFRDRGDRPRRY
jgi:RNA recognition motif-containing protein